MKWISTIFQLILNLYNFIKGKLLRKVDVHDKKSISFQWKYEWLFAHIMYLIILNIKEQKTTKITIPLLCFTYLYGNVNISCNISYYLFNNQYCMIDQFSYQSLDKPLFFSLHTDISISFCYQICAKTLNLYSLGKRKLFGYRIYKKKHNLIQFPQFLSCTQK